MLGSTSHGQKTTTSAPPWNRTRSSERWLPASEVGTADEREADQNAPTHIYIYARDVTIAAVYIHSRKQENAANSCTVLARHRYLFPAQLVRFSQLHATFWGLACRHSGFAVFCPHHRYSRICVALCLDWGSNQRNHTNEASYVDRSIPVIPCHRC